MTFTRSMEWYSVTTINNNFLVSATKRESLIQSLKNISALCIISYAHYLVKFWRNYVVNCIFDDLIFQNFVFFKVEYSIGHTSRMVGSIDVKRTGGSSVGYRVKYVTLISFMKLTFNFSRSNCRIALSQKWLVLLMWNGKEEKLLSNWPNIWTLPLTTPMTSELIFQGQSLNDLFLSNWGPIDMK